LSRRGTGCGIARAGRQAGADEVAADPVRLTLPLVDPPLVDPYGGMRLPGLAGNRFSARS